MMLFNPQYLLLTVKHGCRAVMVEAAIYWGSLGLMITLHDCVTAKEYEAILQNEVHPVVQMLFPGDASMYKDDNAKVHAAK